MTELLFPQRNEIQALANKYRLKNLRIFGSVARGDFRANSDVDILADFPDDFTLFRHAACQREMEAVLGRPVDLVCESALRTRIREAILKEAIPI